MDGGGKQSRLLSRLLGKLRGDQHRFAALDKRFSISSTVLSESTGCGSVTNDEDDMENSAPHPTTASSSGPTDDDQFPANIDLRYGGQYLTPEQLPEFCNQLHNLVEVIRNIQSYAKVTGEYPRYLNFVNSILANGDNYEIALHISELERRLEAEAKEVAALAAEARNARDVVARTRAQRRAVRSQRKHIVSHLATLRETEIRELESTIRLSDRKLFKSWESLKNSTDPSVFEPLLEETKNKQSALECLVRLIESRRATLARNTHLPQPQLLPPPAPLTNDDNEAEATTGASGGRRQELGRRGSNKRRRKEAGREPRSVPLSVEASRHEPQPQVTLFIEGTECTSRYRVGSAGAVALASLELPSHGSVRDILFFTSN